MCCSYLYPGIADPDETSIAAGIALQAYFEGRKIDKDGMERCVQYWRDNISEYSDPVGRKRDVCWSVHFGYMLPFHSINNFLANAIIVSHFAYPSFLASTVIDTAISIGNFHTSQMILAAPTSWLR
jgi:hypothetical protein